MEPSLTVDEAATMVLPTRRLVGATVASNGREVPAFIGHIDEPGSSEVRAGRLSVLRVRGWATSTRSRTVRLVVHVGSDTAVETMCDIPRPDVVQSLGERFGPVDERCGFVADVAVPDAGRRRRSLRMVMTFDDGELETSRAFRVTQSEQPVAPRGDYKATWDAASGDADSAKLAVSGYTDEAEYTRTARQNVEMLEQLLELRPDDEILEIGCGVGRVGAELAPRCRRWVGVDVSSNMLRHARERLQEHDNVELVEISGWDLAPIAAASLDVVYCTVVFMHLDEWERFRYVEEAMRVLRPGGRLYVDNFNLCSEPGWAFFSDMARNYHPMNRPPNISKSSTPDELRTYLERAGFGDITIGSSPESLFLWARGRKH